MGQLDASRVNFVRYLTPDSHSKAVGPRLYIVHASSCLGWKPQETRELVVVLQKILEDLEFFRSVLVVMSRIVVVFMACVWRTCSNNQ
jgi:hypothetical protein